MQLSIKKVEASAASLIQEILDEAPNYSLNTDGVSRDPNGGMETLSTLPPMCAKESKHVLVVYSNNQAIGVVDLIKDYPCEATTFIGLFLLRESSQGRGLGRTAYALVEDYAIKKLGATRVRLAVVDSNPVAPFWKKLGFKETGDVRPHHGQKLKSTKRVMEKTLGLFTVLVGE